MEDKWKALSCTHSGGKFNKVILATLRGQATRHSRVVGEGTHVQVKIGTVATHQTGPSSPTTSCGGMVTPLPCSLNASSGCETSCKVENTNKRVARYVHIWSYENTATLEMG